MDVRNVPSTQVTFVIPPNHPYAQISMNVLISNKPQISLENVTPPPDVWTLLVQNYLVAVQLDKLQNLEITQEDVSIVYKIGKLMVLIISLHIQI